MQQPRLFILGSVYRPQWLLSKIPADPSEGSHHTLEGEIIGVALAEGCPPRVLHAAAMLLSIRLVMHTNTRQASVEGSTSHRCVYEVSVYYARGSDKRNKR